MDGGRVEEWRSRGVVEGVEVEGQRVWSGMMQAEMQKDRCRRRRSAVFSIFNFWASSSSFF